MLLDDILDLDHSTIGRVLKNETSSSSEGVLDDPAEGQCGLRDRVGGRQPGVFDSVAYIHVARKVANDIKQLAEDHEMDAH